MKHSILGLAASCLLAGPALAADLPARSAPPVYVPPPAVFTWTGAYAGINAGYAFNAQDRAAFFGNDAFSSATIGLGLLPTTSFTKIDGFTGGGQIGYNFQLPTPVLGAGVLGGTGIVIGVEADAAYTDLRGRSLYTDGLLGIQTTTRARTDFVGTVRGRLGYAIDRFMVFGTGGFAYGSVRSSTIGTVPGFGTLFAGAQDKLKTGFAYGGGIEYALGSDSMLNFFHSSAVTVKVEYLRYDLGTSSYLTSLDPAFGIASSATTRVATTGDIVRAGLNFKFGAPAVPVVARY